MAETFIEFCMSQTACNSNCRLFDIPGNCEHLFNAERDAERDAKVQAETIAQCAEILSHMRNFCPKCPMLMECDFGTEVSCKERWVKYLTDNIKENKE